MIYMLQASLALALLYSIYWLFLSRTGLHQFNRLILIGIAVTSLAIPILASQLPDWTPTPNIIANGSLSITRPFKSLTIQPFQPAHTPALPYIDYTALVIAAIYTLGLAIFLIRLVAPLLALIGLIRKSPTHRKPQYTLVQLDQPSQPFSFFRYIFFHKADYSETQQTNILLHEQVHIKQHHSLDILFMELYTALCWFNPFAWLLNRQTKLNLEYLADHEMLNAGVEPKEYQYQLLQMSVGPSFTRMANYFNRSHLQKRIAMINSTTRRGNRWKYLLLAPALIALTLVFATGKAQSAAGNAQSAVGNAQSAAGNAPATAKAGNTDIYLVIRPDLTESRIHKIETELAADGIELSLTNLSYTANHQLSGFRIMVSQNGQKLEDLAIDSNGQPLSEPVVFYWLRSRHGNPTLTRGLPGDVDKKDRTTMENLSGLLRKGPGNGEFDLHGAARIGD